MQLQLLGDSLMGWMAWDLMRGVDLLLARDGIDPKRIILLGAVAGGGDPAGVTAALDRRIACCVPFNFGGPQPETRYPLPDDAETSFNYLGGTYWDSTRGLRLGGRDDFLHWVIVASTAPRHLIHAHEFSWDGERDPVWKRYQKIWGEFYEAADDLGVAHGKGLLSGRPPEASHCTNIGAFHRRMIHPLFERWFGIKVTEGRVQRAAQARGADLPDRQGPAGAEAEEPERADERAGPGADRGRPPAAGRQVARRAPAAPARRLEQAARSRDAGQAARRQGAGDRRPAGGRREGRAHRPGGRAGHRGAGRRPDAGQADRPGAGRRRPGAGRQGGVPEGAGRRVAEARPGRRHRRPARPARHGRDRGLGRHRPVHVNLQLFGETLLGERLRDLRSVLAYLRERKDVDAKRLALWGDSFAPPNPADTNFKVPRGVDGWPRGPEPLGGLLALLGALFEDDVRAVYLAGGLASYHGVLTHFAVLIPHGASVPGALTAGDLCDLAGSLAPRPLRLEALVDHLNRPVPPAEMRKAYEPAVKGYAAAPAALGLAETRSSVSAWLLEQLK